jgi:phospholipase C
MAIDRRQFLSGAVGAYGAALLDSTTGLDPTPLFAQNEASAALPPPQNSGIDHIVVVTMENRSFDHFLGWLPGANGKQAGLSYVDTNGVSHPTYQLAPDYMGCGHPDPDHSYGGSRIDYDRGAMDGFLKNPANDIFAIGYYTEKNIPFYAALARNYTTLSSYFCSMLGPTFPNRIFQFAAQTDRLDDSISLSSLPTIFDSLNNAGISAHYYYNNVSFLALWGFQYFFNTFSYDDFLSDAASGNLPAVSYVDPVYTVLDDGTGNDDHPHADIRRGDAFLAKTFHAVANGPNWKKTVFIVNFDENGGFFEHVPPPRAAAPNNVDPDIVNGKTLLGPRVPTVVAAPFTRGNPSSPRVVKTVFDHTSVLKLIEWRWGLSPLTARDASSDVGNLATALNFTKPQFVVPKLPNPTAPRPQACTTLPTDEGARATEFEPLANSDLMHAWNARKRK